MSRRTIVHGMASPGFYLPAVIGATVLICGISLPVGVVLVSLGLFNLYRAAFNPRLDAELEFQEEKHKHGLTRTLGIAERRHLDAIDEYCQKLRRAALNPELADETWDRAWTIVAQGPVRNSVKELRKFRHQLPPLEAPKDTVAEKIERDLTTKREIEKELEIK